MGGGNGYWEANAEKSPKGLAFHRNDWLWLGAFKNGANKSTRTGDLKTCPQSSGLLMVVSKLRLTTFRCVGCSSHTSEHSFHLVRRGASTARSIISSPLST